MSVYSYEVAKNIIDKYYDKGGIVEKIDGCLVDNYICYGDGLKTTIIKEKYLNEWSSGVTIRMYNKTPAKYDKVLDLLIDFYETNEQKFYDEAEKLFFKD